MQIKNSDAIAALDVGSVRIGVAVARMPAALPTPYGIIRNDEYVMTSLIDLINREHLAQLVVGLPRGMSGQETEQTIAVRQFAELIRQNTTIPIVFQDETLTSKKAEAELASRNSRYNKEMVDALAATYILEDYLGARRETANG
jgi:putative Holliday junction resolvase